MVRRRFVFVLFVAITAIIFFWDVQCKANSQLVRSKPDVTCGPKCLWAIMEITKVGKINCDVPCIYKLIGKESSSATSLKDLRDAAEKLGFRAKGYKLGVKDLKELKDYAILPIGRTAGTINQPLHFILITGVTEESLIGIDPEKLDLWTLPLVELQENWDGMALEISSREEGKRLPKPVAHIKKLAQLSMTPKYEGTIDLCEHETGSIVEHSILLPDVSGNSPTYRIIGKSCHCVDAELKRNAEGKTYLAVRIHVSKPGPQEIHVAVAPTEGNAPSRYRFRAYGHDAFQITPRIGYFEAEAGLSVYSVIIEYFPADANAVAVFKRIETDIHGLKCGDVISTHTGEGKTKILNFNIPLLYSVDENQPYKTLNGKVKFILMTSNGERSIPFDLTIKTGNSAFRLIPQKLFLMYSKSSPKATKKAVRLQLHYGLEIQELSLRQSYSLPIQVESLRVSEQEYVLNVVVMPDKLQGLSTGLQKGEIIIGLEGLPKIERITLPVSLVICE